MVHKTISIDMPCTHEEMVDGKLQLYLYLSNIDHDIPFDWHSSNDTIELKLHFSVDLIADTIIDMYRHVGNEDQIVFSKKDKPMADQLIDQLERSLAKMKSITYEE